MKSTFTTLVFLIVATTSFAQDEYFVTLDAQARALSKRLQVNAHSSQNRFDGSTDASKLKAWFIGSCHTPTADYPLIAYWTPEKSYVGVFRGDEQLHDLWEFSYDARQFYVEGTKLMFVARPMDHSDTQDSFAHVPREVVFDFAHASDTQKFKFHDGHYTLSK